MRTGCTSLDAFDGLREHLWMTMNCEITILINKRDNRFEPSYGSRGSRFQDLTRIRCKGCCSEYTKNYGQ